MKNTSKQPQNILCWKSFIFKRDIALQAREGVKFEKLLFVSKEAYSLIEGAANDAEIELIINNMAWKIAIANERGRKFLGMK